MSWFLWLMTLICLILVLRLALTFLLKLALKKYSFSLKIDTCRRYYDFYMKFPGPLSAEVSVREICICLEAFKIVVSINEPSIVLSKDDSIAQKPGSSGSGSALKMLILRGVIQILGKRLIIKISGLVFQGPNVILKVPSSFLLLEAQQDTGEIQMTYNMLSSFLGLFEDSVTIGPLSVQMVLAPYITLIQSFKAGNLNVEIFDIQGFLNISNFMNLESKNNQDKKEILLPAYTKISVHKVRLGLDILSISGKNICVELKNEKALEVSGECSDLEVMSKEHQILSVPSIYMKTGISEQSVTGSLEIDLVKATIDHSLTYFIAKVIPKKKKKSSKKSNKDINFSVVVRTIELELFHQTSLLKGKIDTFFINTENSNFSLQVKKANVQSPEIQQVIYLRSPSFSMSENKMCLVCDKTKIFLTRTLYETCFLAIFQLLKPLFSSPKSSSKSSPKPFFMNFQKISVYLDLAPLYKLDCTVHSFEGNIHPKEFELIFTDSKIYATETRRHHVINSALCYVHKQNSVPYSNTLVRCEGTDLFLPAEYHLGMGVFQALNFGNIIVKWTIAMLRPDKDKILKIFVPERGKISLVFTKVALYAEDDLVSISQRKKYKEGPVLANLKSSYASSLMTLKIEEFDMLIDNIDLYTPELITNAMSEMDEFPLPEDMFFKLLLARDLKFTISDVSIQIRDFPFNFFTLGRLIGKGRSVLSKNRLPLPFWATFKSHYKFEVIAKEGSCVAGVCMTMVFRDLMDVAKRMILKRKHLLAEEQSATTKLSIIDRLRYSMIGKAKVQVKDFTMLLLSGTSPYEVEGLRLEIDSVNILTKSGTILLQTNEISCNAQENLLTLPKLELEVHYFFQCENQDHWIIDFQHTEYDIFESFRCKELDIEASVDIPSSSDRSLTLCYNSQESPLLIKLIGLLVKPPPMLIQGRPPKKPNIFLMLIHTIKLTSIKVSDMKLLMFTENSSGLEMHVEKAEFRIELTKRKHVILIPWEMNNAAGAINNVHMGFYGEPDNELMHCMTIEYYEGSLKSDPLHNLNIDGFKLLWNYKFQSILLDLLTYPNISLKKKKKPVQNELRIIEEPEFLKYEDSSDKVFQRSLKFLIEIKRPQIVIQNQESMSQVLILSRNGICEISIDSLPYDFYCIDFRRNITLFLENMEAFTTLGNIDINQKVFWLENTEGFMDEYERTGEVELVDGVLRRIFVSRNMRCNVCMFALPMCHYDFAVNKEAEDQYKWMNEKRTNKIELALPDIQSSLESEHLWTVIDVVQSIMVQDNLTAKITEEEYSRLNEFKRYGNKRLQSALSENLQTLPMTTHVAKSRISIILDSLTMKLKKKEETIVNVDLMKVQSSITTYSNGDSQKIVEVHRIDFLYGNQSVILPLMLEGEDFIDSSCMLSLRISDTVIPGRDTSLWPGVEHLELFLHPMSISMSRKLYKDIYAFVFPQVDEDFYSLYESSKARKKPLLNRLRLPRFYKYVNINEIKLALNIRKLGMKDTKIRISTFTTRNKLKNTNQLFDKYMKHALRNLLTQVPSLIKQKIKASKMSKFLIKDDKKNKGLIGTILDRERDQQNKYEAKASVLPSFHTN